MDDQPERKRVVVHRPEPPSDERKPQLTKDEVRALLTVTEVTHRPWGRVARRGAIAAVATTLLSLLLDTWLGWWSIPLLVVLAIAWTVRPLIQQSRGGWT